MALDKLIEQTRQELQDVSAKWATAKEEAERVNKEVIELFCQKKSLEAALDALEGKGRAEKQVVPVSSVFSSSTSIVQGTQVTLNGEPIILEPGFKIEKDAEGYERLVPESGLISDLYTPPARTTPTSFVATAPIPDFSEPEKLI